MRTREAIAKLLAFESAGALCNPETSRAPAARFAT
jgi:hypothetical protein